MKAAATPMMADVTIAARPEAHNTARANSGTPCKGKRPVQFGMAVNRKPATAAMAKPWIISWACQATGSIPIGSTTRPDTASSQSTIESAAHSAAPRKNGRNPSWNSAGALILR